MLLITWGRVCSRTHITRCLIRCTIWAKWICNTINSSWCIYDILTIFVIIILSGNFLPTRCRVAYTWNLKPLSPRFVTNRVKTYIRDFVTSINTHATTNIYTNMTILIKTKTMNSWYWTNRAWFRRSSNHRFCYSLTTGIWIDKSTTVNRANWSTTPNILPMFVISSISPTY